METFIPSTPSPAGFSAPAAGLGGQAAPADAPASGSGLFLQILLGSCTGQAPACGEPAEAPVEGRKEDSSEGEAASVDGGKVAAEGVASASLFIPVPPPDAQEPLPEAEAAVSGEGAPAGAPEDSDAGLFASAGKAAGAFAGSTDDAAADGPVRVGQPAAGNAQAAPAKAAPVQAAPVAAAALAAGERTDAAPHDAPAADAAAARAPLADPVRPAAKEAPASRPEGYAVVQEEFAAAPGMGPASGRTGPQAAAPRVEPASSRPGPPVAAPPREAEGEPAGADLRDAGNSPVSGKEDPKPFSFTLAREKASADEAPEEARGGNATLPSARETAEPGASHGIAAGRGAAETASGARSPLPAPPAAHPQRTFHAGENAFVLTRKSDTSMEITLSPPGVGRLEIEVILDKGVVNANITAADPAGREAIERSLPQIVQALADEGMAIGGFTVSLKQGNEQDGNAQAGNAQAGKGPGNGSSGADAPGTVRPAAERSGLVDILV